MTSGVGRGQDESLFLFRRRLRALHPGAVLDLHGQPRSRLLAIGLGHTQRVVWKKRGLWSGLAVRVGLRRYHAEVLIAERYHAAVERLVGCSLPAERLSLSLEPGARARVEGRLRAVGVDPAGVIVGMSPGAMWATKRWPLQGFGELARRCVAVGMQVVLTGSADEAPDTAEVARVSGAVDLAVSSVRSS